MIKEVELKTPDIPRPLYWMSLAFILIFIVWLFLLLSDSIFATKLLIKQDLSSLSDTFIVKEPIVYSLISSGSEVKAGESIGVKTNKETWDAVRSIEALIKDETNLNDLVNKITGLSSGVEEIDNQLNSLLQSIQTSSSKKKTNYVEKESVRTIKIDNSRKIAQAKEDLKEIQLKYAIKKVSLETLKAASKKLKTLIEEDGKESTTKQIVKTKVPVSIIENDINLTEENRSKISNLLRTINNWKTNQIIEAPASGNLVNESINGKVTYKIISSKNYPVFYLDSYSKSSKDSLRGAIEMPGKQSFPATAIWNSKENRYNLENQDALLNNQYTYNSNARIVFKPTGHSYYDKIKSYLCHK